MTPDISQRPAHRGRRRTGAVLTASSGLAVTARIRAASRTADGRRRAATASSARDIAVGCRRGRVCRAPQQHPATAVTDTSTVATEAERPANLVPVHVRAVPAGSLYLQALG